MVRVTILFASLAALSGCRPKASAASEVKYGHLDQRISQSLLNVPPNGKVSICGDGSPDVTAVADSIRQWLVPIGRDSHVTIEQNCDLRNADAAVDVSATPKGNDLAYCQSNPGIIGFSSPYGRMNAGGTIVRCAEIDPTEVTSYAMHEAGHLFAMCDQYSRDAAGNFANVGMHQSCSETNTNGVATDSVMNAGLGKKPQTLTADDNEGIKAMANRRDIRANAAWATFLQGGTPSTGTSESTSTSTSKTTATQTSTGVNSTTPPETATSTSTATSPEPTTQKKIKSTTTYEYSCLVLCVFEDKGTAAFMLETTTKSPKTRDDIFTHYNSDPKEREEMRRQCRIRKKKSAPSEIESLEMKRCRQR